MSTESTATHADGETFDVIVVGAGPIGLVSAIQLGRAGVKTLVLERRATFSLHPKAAGIHARTMEIHRQLGLAALIHSHGTDYKGQFSIGWMTRLHGIEIGAVTVGATQEEKDLFNSWSPEPMAFCSQDVYEPLFGDALRQYPSVNLRMACEAKTIGQNEDWVTVGYSHADAAKFARARYLIAADGVRSPTRSRLGITESGVEPFGSSMSILFKADLEAYRAGRNYGIFWVVNKDIQGALAWGLHGESWAFNFEADDNDDPANYTPERCTQMIRAAIGVLDVPIEVGSILHWKHDQAVTDRWRVGRVFLAGDASHRFPPHGGFGMNSGVQDSFNLVWKLLARLRWGAGDALLDTYELERKPIAQSNGEQCLLNTRRMEAMGWLQKKPEVFAAIETPEGEPIREKMRSALSGQREQVFSQGQQFGQIYPAGALVDDGTLVEESSVSTYRPTGHPGARAPHIWLESGENGPRSTVDLYNGGFILFAASYGESWLAAAAKVAESVKAPITAFRIGGTDCRPLPGKPRWEDVVGVGATGALLIRPDGYVAARWRTLPDNPSSVLQDAMKAILNLSAQ